MERDVNPKSIWLAPSCHSQDSEGRTWCEDNVWDDGECNLAGCICVPIKYIREDVHLNRVTKLRVALLGILEIGKRGMSNSKYDEYFEEARKSLSE